VRRALTLDSLGAWLLKASPADGALDDVVAEDFRSVTTRCVRPSYRTELVRPGQPVLLWVSGSDPRHPSGISARGRTTGTVVVTDQDGPVMPVSLCPVDPAVPRGLLLQDPVLARLEVLRMPAGSNPSYLDRAQYAALCSAFPQVDHREGRQAGTA
jgi:hypothetical protein